MSSYNNTIDKRLAENKSKIIEQLKQIPIVQVACQKTGLGRATYYRWRKNRNFLKLSDDAISEGRKLINDLAESQLLTAIKDGNMTGIIYWLNHNHPTYATKVEVTTRLKESEVLTPEQEAIVTRALSLAGFIPEKNQNDKT